MNKKILLSAAVIGGVLVTSLGIGKATAQEEVNPMQSLVQKIAQKFNLNQADVEAVFEEHRNQHHAQMEVKFSEHLDQAVAEGEITAEQKQRILSKRQELQQTHEDRIDEFMSMTPEERRSTIKAEHEELKAWAESNGIDLKYLLGGGVFIKHVGGKPFGFKEKFEIRLGE